MDAQHEPPVDAGGDAVVVDSDGKPGHLNQSLGLAEALQCRVPGLAVGKPGQYLGQAGRQGGKQTKEKPHGAVRARSAAVPGGRVPA